MTLGVSHAQRTAVHPVAGKGFAVGPFALGDFVFVMRKNQVRSAAVNVESFAEVVATHRRAFNVPTGTSRAPGRIPLRFAGFGVFPEHEVHGVALGGADFDAGARLHVVERPAGKFPVPFELTHGVIDIAVFGGVGEALLFKPRHDVEHLRNELGGMRLIRGIKTPQGAHILLHRLCEGRREFARRNAFFRGAADDLVVHVRNVAHERYLKARRLKPTADDVKCDERAAVTDMAIVIDRNAADVHPDFAGGKRFKRNHLVVQSGIKRQCHRNS